MTTWRVKYVGVEVSTQGELKAVRDVSNSHYCRLLGRHVRPAVFTGKNKSI
jgi:hypothetical protein